jgi:hypothetical protein
MQAEDLKLLPLVARGLNGSSSRKHCAILFGGMPEGIGGFFGQG